jgi:hypothetical protein
MMVVEVVGGGAREQLREIPCCLRDILPRDHRNKYKNKKL